MKILIKGAGDLATGIAHRLYKAGYEIIMTEIETPTTVRRTVAFSQAVYDKICIVEDVTAELAENVEEAEATIASGRIAVVVDPMAKILHRWKPEVIVDAILAKKNLGTKLSDADYVIGVGPGFTAGTDCHAVIETKRGHYLGRVITNGSAIPNTGIPGNIGGYTTERLIRAEADGVFEPIASIGDMVEKGQLVAYVRPEQSSVTPIPIYAKMSGIVRGMLQEGVIVSSGMKSGDIDARCERAHCFTISDKARAVGGGVLEAVCAYEHIG